MKVCFVAENAYPAIADGNGAAFGGMETQAWAFARSLRQLECCEVGLCVSSPKRFQFELHDGVQVFNRQAFFEHVRRNVAQHCTIQHSWPPLRVRRWSNSLLWQIPLLLLTKPLRSPDRERESVVDFYRALPADVVIAFGVSSLTTAIIEAAKAAGKRTVISCASNDDLRREYQIGSTYVNAYGDSGDFLARGLQAADQIFVQTEWQQELARNNLKLETNVLANPIDERWPRWAESGDRLLADLTSRQPQVSKSFILWTGRTDRFHKRPALAFDVARRLATEQFVMVLNNTDSEYFAELLARCPQNVLILPTMPHPQFVALLSRATAFLSTGSHQYEGFPNVFLQAGVLGVPVVSADCDFGILSKTGIGRSFNDSTDGMVELLREICSSSERRREIVKGVSERTQHLYGGKTIATRLWELLNQAESARFSNGVAI